MRKTKRVRFAKKSTKRIRKRYKGGWWNLRRWRRWRGTAKGKYRKKKRTRRKKKRTRRKKKRAMSKRTSCKEKQLTMKDIMINFDPECADAISGRGSQPRAPFPCPSFRRGMSGPLLRGPEN